MDIIGNYFRPAQCTPAAAGDIGEALACTEKLMASAHGDLATLLAEAPELKDEIRAMLTLAHASERLITPIIAVTTASGTLLRRKLEPVLDPMLQQFAVLRHTVHTPSGSRLRRRGAGN
jgi:hypothetical protein